MSRLLIALTLLVACSGERTGWRLEKLAESELRRAVAGVDEDAEAPLFGGMAEESPEAMVDLEEEEKADFAGEEINLVPSGFTPSPNSAGVVAGGTALPPSSGLFVDEGAGKPDAPATPRTWRRSALAAHSAKLEVGDEETLPLEATHVTVKVDGFRARVALDLYFRNDRDKLLQGMLKLRLPDGATPDYTAFGVAAKIALPEAPGTTIPELEKRHASLKQARIVPRERAARAYTETVRRKIDPALVEWAGAGIYNVRVFPLEPGKVHQISVAYDLDLTPVGDDLVYRLDLPEKTGDLQISVRADGATLNGVKSDDGRFSFVNPEERVFEARLQAPGNLVLTGADDATGPLYAARVTPGIPDEAGDPASDAIFLVDTSLSSNPDRLNVWLDLMDRILERNRATLKRFRVGFFDVGFHWWRAEAVRNTPAEAAAVRAYAQSLLVEGATDLGAALAEAAKIEGRCDLFLLSDGAATWGDGDVLPVRAEHTLFAYATGLAGTDARLLGRLARDSGGALFAVSGADALDKVAVAHAKRPWRIAGIDAPGSDVLVRGRPTAIYPGQPLVVCGRGAFDGAIKLRLTQGDRSIEVDAESARSLASDLAASVYGQAAVEQLEEAGAEARAYAQHFRVVGRTCSLVMLESEEDYEEYDIEPEDDAEFVREHPATATLAAARGAKSDKERLHAWLAKIESVEVEGALADAVEAADASVAAAPLATRARLWTEVPGGFQEELVARKLVLADVEAEAERRRGQYGSADALKVLSSRIEENPGDWALVRDVAYSALDWGEAASAYHLFRRAAEARPWEPHSYLGMARALEAMDRVDLAKVWYEVALAGGWEQRYGAFPGIARVHYLSFLRKHRDARLETLVPEADPKTADLIVTVFWNTDASDVDLHVVDADGEQCWYSHTGTAMGGSITTDVTDGFRPEMFVQPHAKPGKYDVWVSYFAEDATRLTTRTRVFATIFENFGREDEKSRTVTLVLATGKENHPIARMVKRD